MSFWQKLFSVEQHNEHKNQIACVENDCSFKTNEQLLEALSKATDEEIEEHIDYVSLIQLFVYYLFR